jgi:hypothetical protein
LSPRRGAHPLNGGDIAYAAPPGGSAGIVKEVIDDISRLFTDGATEVALRITSWDWQPQLRLLTEEIIPAVRSAS